MNATDPRARAPRRAAALVGAALATLLLSGCCCGRLWDPVLPPPFDGGRPAIDAYVPRDVGPDARVDAGPCPLSPGRASGAPCNAGDRCFDPLDCQTELRGTFPDTILPDGGTGPDLDVLFFPGSMCARICDPEGDGSECASGCEVCNGAVLAGRVRFATSAGVPATCRPVCTPTDDGRGCEREGYACDPQTGTCMEACIDDAQCRFALVDRPDGSFAVLHRPDLVATCNHTTGRCEVEGDDRAAAGDPCATDTDCEDDGTCLTGDDWPGGYCTRFGCAFPGFECDGEDEVCDLRAMPGTSACLEGCMLGAEATDSERLGAGGGSPSCDVPGFSCVWNGGAGSELDGSCVAGNYNDEAAYDVGTSCLRDEECFSPFGYGRCLFADAESGVPAGICAIASCAGGAGGVPIGILGSDRALEPRVASELCDVAGGDVCVNAGDLETPRTLCLASCESAAECPPGYACSSLVADGVKVCWPRCRDFFECRAGACRDLEGGICDSDEECRCVDAAGTP